MLGSLRQMVLGTGETIAGAVYGTIVVMATIVAGGANDGIDTWQLALTVTVTTAVLGLAHLYAELVAHGIEHGRRLTRDERRVVFRREAAIPLSAALPVAVLVAGAAGLLEEDTAVWAALLVGLGTLVVQSLRYGRVEHLGRGRVALAVLLNLALGLTMVLLKVAISH